MCAGAVILIAFFIYGHIGTILFGRIRNQVYVNGHANFSSMPMSLLTLFRIATYDEWRPLMDDCRRKPLSECDGERAECGSYMAVPYFTSFVFLVNIILIYFITAILSNNFER